MKKIFLIFVLFCIFIIKNVECQIYTFISYSFSPEFSNGNNNINHSIGYEFIWGTLNYSRNRNKEYFHNIGLYFWDKYFRINYNYYLIGNINDHGYMDIGPGINIIFGENNGISPQMDIIINGGFVKFNLTYRYNIYFNNKNTHEFGLTVSIIEVLGTLIFSFWDY